MRRQLMFLPRIPGAAPQPWLPSGLPLQARFCARVSLGQVVEGSREAEVLEEDGAVSPALFRDSFSPRNQASVKAALGESAAPPIPALPAPYSWNLGKVAGPQPAQSQGCHALTPGPS